MVNYNLQKSEIKTKVMNTVIMTGATGFIGSRIALEFLKSGWKVYALGRDNNDVAYQNRIINAVNDIDEAEYDRTLFRNLKAVVTDICEPDLGTDLQKIDLNRNSQTILFHVAGDTSFHPGDPEKQYRINVNGTLNTFKAFGNLVDIAVHVSTAYVAGTRKGLILENELNKGQSFHNTYEKSKFDAETTLHRLADELSIPLTIQRPSIIINDSNTGRSSSFTHLNALVEVIKRVQNHYNIQDGEVVHEEIRHMIFPDSHPNMAPVDPVVDAMVALGKDKKSIGRTFHLCHPDPQSNIEVIDLLSQAFHVKDLIRFPFVTDLPEDLTWTEQMIFRSLKLYLPYMNNECTFDLTNTRSIIPDYDSCFKPIDLEFIDKVIKFQRSLS